MFTIQDKINIIPKLEPEVKTEEINPIEQLNEDTDDHYSVSDTIQEEETQPKILMTKKEENQNEKSTKKINKSALKAKRFRERKRLLKESLSNENSLLFNSISQFKDQSEFSSLIEEISKEINYFEVQFSSSSKRNQPRGSYITSKKQVNLEELKQYRLEKSRSNSKKQRDHERQKLASLRLINSKLKATFSQINNEIQKNTLSILPNIRVKVENKGN